MADLVKKILIANILKKKYIWNFIAHKLGKKKGMFAWN